MRFDFFNHLFKVYFLPCVSSKILISILCLNMVRNEYKETRQWPTNLKWTKIIWSTLMWVLRVCVCVCEVGDEVIFPRFLYKLGSQFLAIPIKNGGLTGWGSEKWADDSDFIEPSIYRDSIYKENLAISVLCKYFWCIILNWSGHG